MSQNTLKTRSNTGAVQVSAGWDNPTQQVFCNILPLDDDDETDYSDVFMMSFVDGAHVAQFLQEAFGVHLPQAMQDAISQDARVKARNLLRRFSPEGAVELEQAF